MTENFAIWDFELSPDEMEKISRKDLGRSEIIDHSDPAVVKMLSGFRF